MVLLYVLFNDEKIQHSLSICVGCVVEIFKFH